MSKATLLAVSSLVPAAGVIFAMAQTVESLRARQQELQEASAAIIDGAGDNDLSEEQLATIKANATEIENLARQVEARESVARPAAGAGRRTDAEPGNPGNGSRPAAVPAQPRGDVGRGGFRNMGEFSLCVRDAITRADAGAQTRLRNAATTYGSEGVGADGGFLVPPDFRREIVEKVMGEGSLLDRTDRLVTASNSMVLPKDETTPWQNSGGILSYWEGEADALQETKVALQTNNIRLNKLTTLVKVTDELLEDAALLDTYLRRKAPVKMTAKINTAIINGTGVGQPLGILRSGALVTVPIEVSQEADSIYFENIIKMASRLYVGDNATPVWLINQNTLPALSSMRFVRTADSPVPVWLPANGLAGRRFSTLMGYDVVPVQACPKLGDLGDIILGDMSAYLTATKGTDIRTDVSIHLHFDQDITSYRFIMRVAGQPWWAAPITPQNASETLGSFIALEAR